MLRIAEHESKHRSVRGELLCPRVHCSGGLPANPALEGGEKQGRFERGAKRVGVEGNGYLLGVFLTPTHLILRPPFEVDCAFF